MNKKTYLFAILSAFALLACSNNRSDSAEQPTPKETKTEIPRIILDADIGSSTDDLFALQNLYDCHKERKCKLIGVVVDRMGENNAAIVDVMNTYFGLGDIPIGLERDGAKNPKIWIDYGELPADTNEDGSPMFKRSVDDYSKLLDGYKLYRKLLAGNPDHSITIVSTGFVTSLAHLLKSEADEYSDLSGVELVKAKVKGLYIMGGDFGEAAETDYNFRQALDFSIEFFRLWPIDVPRVFSPGEVGDELEYPSKQVIEDISWTDVHPIKQVYMNNNCNTGQKMWDVLAVLNAVYGDSLFSISDRGRITYADDRTYFTKDPEGNDRYQFRGDNKWNADMLQRIRNVNMKH